MSSQDESSDVIITPTQEEAPQCSSDVIITPSQENTLLEAPQSSSGLSQDIEMLSFTEPKEDIFKDLNVFVLNLIEEFVPNDQKTIKIQAFKTIRAKLNPNTKKVVKKELVNLKEHLLDSTRRYNLEFESCGNISTLYDGISSIKKQQKLLKEGASFLVFTYIQIGCILKQLKALKPKNLVKTLTRNNIPFSLSYVNFLIRLFNFAEQFPRVQYLTLPIKYIMLNFVAIKRQISADSQFWANI